MAHRSGHEGLLTRPLAERIAAPAICGIITIILLCIGSEPVRSPALHTPSGPFLATDGSNRHEPRPSSTDSLTMFTLARSVRREGQEASQPRLFAKLQKWDRPGRSSPEAGMTPLSLTSRSPPRQSARMREPAVAARSWLPRPGSPAPSSGRNSNNACVPGIFVAIRRESRAAGELDHPSPIRGALLADIW